MARILLTGGRAPVSLDLARYFSDRGHQVFVAESQMAQLTRTSRAVSKFFAVPPPRTQSEAFVKKLSEILRQEKIDLLIPTCEEVFYIAQGAPTLRQFSQILVDDFAKLNRLHSKWEFNQWAQSCEFDVPLSYRIQNFAELESHAPLQGQWILKPSFSRFGIEIHKGTLSELIALNLPASPDRPWVLQQFKSGEEICAYAVANHGKLTALSLYRHQFVAGKAGICFEEVDPPGLKQNIERFLQKIEFNGQIAFDFIVEDGKYYALECNPRATSGIHLLTTQAHLDQVFLKQEGFVRAKTGQKAMLLLAMLSFGLGQIRSLPQLWLWLKTLCTSPEVIFSLRDPIPFFDQLLCMAQLIAQSRREKVNVLAMSTLDIEWNGTP